MMSKLFGTDGVRGEANKELTPELAFKLGRFGGYVLAQHAEEERPSVLVGRDTRISGRMLEYALVSGLLSTGAEVLRLGVISTPGVAYLTRQQNATAGIMISASHNPAKDNGIKFFSIDGTKLPDAVEEAIEAEMEKEISCVDSAELGKASRIVDAAGRYIEFCKATFPNELSLSELKIVVDCANGATYHIAPNVLRERSALEEMLDGGQPPEVYGNSLIHRGPAVSEPLEFTHLNAIAGIANTADDFNGFAKETVSYLLGALSADAGKCDHTADGL